MATNEAAPTDSTVTQPLDAAARGRLLLLLHGSIIAIIGLVSGFGLVFAILEAYSVWPLTIPSSAPVPGSEHGWRIAHVAGVMNGMLMMITGLALPHVAAGRRALAWIVGSMIYTGWGNTIFFHCANVSHNRGLSAGATRFGPADLAGTAGYLIGASTIPFTILALVLIAQAARRRLAT